MAKFIAEQLLNYRCLLGPCLQLQRGYKFYPFQGGLKATAFILPHDVIVECWYLMNDFLLFIINFYLFIYICFIINRQFEVILFWKTREKKQFKVILEKQPKHSTFQINIYFICLASQIDELNYFKAIYQYRQNIYFLQLFALHDKKFLFAVDETHPTQIYSFTKILKIPIKKFNRCLFSLCLSVPMAI